MLPAINWKLFFVLLGASVAATIMVLPYTATITSTAALFTPFVIFITILQSAIQFSVTIFIGLYLAKKVGFGSPMLEDVIKGKEIKKYFKSILRISVGLGLLGGILVIVFSLLYVPLPELVRQAGPPIPFWQNLLAIFYGGIGEEILFRLFIMTLFVWISFKIKKTPSGKPTTVGIWLAIIISAIFFGLGHLPVASSYVTINPMTITEAIVNNGIIAIFCGWLYWKKGLESAMIAHCSSDIVLHLLVPILILHNIKF